MIVRSFNIFEPFDFVRSILLEIPSPRPSLLLTFIYNSIPDVELVLAGRLKNA
jgi:hypothetical protein